MKKFLIYILIFSSLQTSAQDLIPYRKGDKFGFANRQQQVVIEPKFNEVGTFRHYPATWVRVGDKYGYINNEGELITKIEFDEARDFYFPTAIVTKNDSMYCIGLKGKPQECLNGCGGVYLSGYRHFRTYKKDEKIGTYKRHCGHFELDSFYCYFDSTAAIWDKFIENGQGLVAVSVNGKWGVLNNKLELIIDFYYDEIELTPYEYRNHIFITKKDNHYGFIDYNGKIIADPIYTKVDYFEYGVAKVWTSDDFWFYIDTEGNEYFEK